jgi:peptidoglycan/LPS O-acetylase OafA/YrhL
MTATQNAPANYPFVDWIRMIAMLGIIWAHTPNFEGSKNFPSLDNIPLYFFFMDFFKFGVICFFLISGFLLASKIDSTPPLLYFKNRLFSTLFAYLFAFGLIVLLFVFKSKVLNDPGALGVGQYIIFMFLESAMWFLPNYWISLAVILCFRKYLKQLWLGALFLTVTIAYTYVLVYTDSQQPHVYALFAYVFYLWLGYYIGRHKYHLHFQGWNPYVLVALCGLTYIFASYESFWLYTAGSPNPMTILRVGNQLFSVIAFITMVRLFNAPFNIPFLNPRKETFGIYLYHMFPLAVLAFALKILGKLGVNTYSDNTLVFMGWFVLKFIFVYLATLLIVKFCIRYRIGFLNYGMDRSKSTMLVNPSGSR